MTQPQGFIHPDYSHHVCKLNKSLYGLKQAPRAWFHKFSSFLLSLGFTCSQTDPSMFLFRASGVTLILLLYVDDIIFSGISPAFLHHLIHLLSTQFPMKDLNDLYYFLGGQVMRTPDMLFLSQCKYIQDLLTCFRLTKPKRVRTPLRSRTMLSLMDGDLLSDPTKYRSMVGALQCLNMMRPDIACAVNLVSQFMHAPRTAYLLAVQRFFFTCRVLLIMGWFLKKRII